MAGVPEEAKTKRTETDSVNFANRNESEKNPNQEPITNNHKPLPKGINADAWKEFEQHRKEMNQPLTDLARQKAMKVIEGMSPEDQAKVIDTTIQNRWKGLFPGKLKTTNGQPYDWRKNL